jgi:hypothetical protein
MGVAQFENVQVSTLSFSTSSSGEQSTAKTDFFKTRATVENITNSMRISEKYRLYSSVVKMTFNFSPNMKTVVRHHEQYSIAYRSQDWRIAEAREADDRMTVSLFLYTQTPSAAV